MPRHVRRFVVATAGLASLVTASALATLVHASPMAAWMALATAAGLAALIAASRAASVPFTFRQRRFGLNADEVVLLAGFALLPTPLVVLGVAAGTAAVEVFKRYDPWKTVFNVASYTLATGAAASAFVLISRVGTPVEYAALAVPPVAAVVAYLLLAQVLALLEGESPFRVFAERFTGITLASSAIGVAVGSAVVALYHASPVLSLVVVPLLVGAWHVARTEARQDRELATHHALAEMSRTLVDCRHPGPIADAVVRSAARVFDAHTVEVTLRGADGAAVERAFTVPGTEASEDPALHVPVRGMDGVTVGVMDVKPRLGARPFREHERALAETIASAAAVALATADSLAGMESSRKRLDAYLNSSRDVILVFAPGTMDAVDASPRYVNEGARELAERAVGGTGAVHERLMQAVRGSTLRRRGGTDVEIPLRAGGVIVLEVENAFVPGGDVLVVARDVTEARRLAAVETEQRRALERNERLAALGTLVAGVAHEVNNPLMYMRGQTELVKMDLEALRDGEDVANVDAADAVRRLDRVVSGIERLEFVSRNLGRVAKGGTARGSLVDVRDLVTRAADAMRGKLPPGVELDVHVPQGALTVHGDASALEQAVMNVLQNAIEAAPAESGHVSVHAHLDADGAVLLRVTDDGPGIPEEDVESIFSPFFTTKHEGTGLGLAFVQATVSAHGGTISVDPRPGEGAVFTLRFPPLARDEAA